MDNAAAGVERLWLDRNWGDRDSYLKPSETLLAGVMRSLVMLISSFFNTRATAVTGDSTEHILLPDDFLPDFDFLRQPIGTLVHDMQIGHDFPTADNHASKVAKEISASNIQAVQVKAAEGWAEKAHAEGTPIVGYRRVPRGVTCAHCNLAAQRLYFRGDLAPIHRNCDCGVAPVFEGEKHGLFTKRTKLVPLKEGKDLGLPSLDQSTPIHS